MKIHYFTKESSFYAYRAKKSKIGLESYPFKSDFVREFTEAMLGIKPNRRCVERQIESIELIKTYDGKITDPIVTL